MATKKKKAAATKKAEKEVAAQVEPDAEADAPPKLVALDISEAHAEMMERRNEMDQARAAYESAEIRWRKARRGALVEA